MDFKNILIVFMMLAIMATDYGQIVANAQVTDTQVIIVGAGISGHAAAARLIERGINNIIILEAEGRIGGRINSIPYDTGFIDIGGQWIHGEGGNSIYELARPFFNFGDTGFESATYLHSQSNGAPLNQAMVNRVFTAANEILEDYSRMMLDRGSLGEYFHREFMARLQRPDMADVPLDLAMSVEEFIHETQCSYYATHDWNRIEARHHATWDVTEGNQWLTWRDRGFQTVFNIIQSPRQGTFFNVTGRIQLNKVVSRIVWNEGGRTRVHCTDGSQYTADHVIVTVSLGVLKATHTTLFQPALPPSKVSSIQHMEYGTLEKVIMVYQQPFWPADDPNWVQYSILWTREDIAALTGTEREWLIRVKYIFRVDTHRNLLEFFLIGRRFGNMGLLTTARISQDITWLFRRFVNPSVAAPIHIWRTSWTNQNNFRGSYSYMSVDTIRNRVSPATLAESLMVNGRPVVLFAGEATDTFYGYANGALTSGYRAAEEIVSHRFGNRLSNNVYVERFNETMTMMLTKQAIN